MATYSHQLRFGGSNSNRSDLQMIRRKSDQRKSLVMVLVLWVLSSTAGSRPKGSKLIVYIEVLNEIRTI